MSIWFVLWLGGAAALIVFWVVRCVLVPLATRGRLLLGEHSHDGPPVDAPKVSVIVAAKDEEKNIEACVSSLLQQDYPNWELIVVDDRSRDRTPALLRKWKDRFGDRLRVVTVTTLPEGWMGKNHAMREGVAVSSGEWLLFTDADCRQISCRTLSVAMSEAVTHDVDFLCITPVLETLHVWERIVQPVCAYMLILWFLPTRVNDPKKRSAYANGAFMLLRRSCYEGIGGHERVRAEANEDVRMARYAKRMGFRLRVVENDNLYCTRMYDTLKAAWHGWSRIFYGCLRSIRRLAVASGLLVLVSMVPWLCLLIALIGCLTTDGAAQTPWRIAAVAWLVVIVVSQISKWQVYKLLRVPPVWSLTYFLGAWFALSVMISAMFKVLGATGTTWRGTTYWGGQNDEPLLTTVSESQPASPDAMEEPSAQARPA